VHALDHQQQQLRQEQALLDAQKASVAGELQAAADVIQQCTNAPCANPKKPTKAEMTTFMKGKQLAGRLWAASSKTALQMAQDIGSWEREQQQQQAEQQAEQQVQLQAQQLQVQLLLQPPIMHVLLPLPIGRLPALPIQRLLFQYQHHQQEEQGLRVAHVPHQQLEQHAAAVQQAAEQPSEQEQAYDEFVLGMMADASDDWLDVDDDMDDSCC
jgi:hypothetical protein